MEYKTILVHVDASSSAQEKINIAAALAKQFDSHLIGAATIGVTSRFFMPGAIGENNLALIGPALDQLREKAIHLLLEFEETARKMGVKSFEKRIIDDDAGAGLSLQAHYSDLVVIGQLNPSDFSPLLRADFPEYVLMNAGRPVLFVPYAGQFPHVGTRVLVAWDAGMEATRAVTAAIPVLRQADAVQILIYDIAKHSATHDDQSGTNIALYLARHGINVEVSEQKMPSNIDVGNALLSHATDFAADLIIMGGYGHTRFHEVLLGGVTHTVLASMTVPVLMTH